MRVSTPRSSGKQYHGRRLVTIGPCRARRSVSLSARSPPPGQLCAGQDRASPLFSEHQGQSVMRSKHCPSPEETRLPSSLPRHVFHSLCLARWRHERASNRLRVCIASACSFNLICTRPGRHLHGSVGRSGKCGCGQHGNLLAVAVSVWYPLPSSGFGGVRQAWGVLSHLRAACPGVPRRPGLQKAAAVWRFQ